MQANEAAGLPNISVSPAMGKLLHLLTRMHRVRTILEIGTLGGYSTIWLARALPADGRLRHARSRSQACRNRAVQHREGGREPSGRRPPRSCHRNAADSWTPKGSHRSTSSSSTPTSRARPNTSGGRSSCRAREASSSWTTSCVTARSWTRPAATPACRACGASSRCWRPSLASAQRRSRPSGRRAMTGSPSPSCRHVPDPSPALGSTGTPSSSPRTSCDAETPRERTF